MEKEIASGLACDFVLRVMNKQELAGKLASLGIAVPNILLPAADIDPAKFAVIACDQHSAEPDYWEETRKIVGDAPSSLNLMLPEAWLNRKDEMEPQIEHSMEQYLTDGTLQSVGEGLVYVRRTVGVKADGSPLIRHGLVAAIDLEKYDYVPGNHNLIRATEATVKERLPERIRIREKASLEMPHVLVMLDDEKNQLCALLEEMRTAGSGGSDAAPGGLKCLYDFDLMQDGGHIEGYLVNQPQQIEAVAEVLSMLYGASEDGFLMAVGDGNHSLAAAKETWKAHPENPALRYALVELISVFDEGLSFHPIHRLLMGLDPSDIPAIRKELRLNDAELDLQDLQPRMDAWLSEYQKTHPSAELEYIHGREECLALGEKSGNLPIVFDRFERGSFFRTVLENGTFVRKSFSLGEAREKRYYLECRRLR